MNVYSLYDIRDRMVEGEEKRQLALLDDLVDNVVREFYRPFQSLVSLELEPVERSIEQKGEFPPLVHERIIDVSNNPIFDGIYYTPEGDDPCLEDTRIYTFNHETQRMDHTEDYPSTICDGVGLARTKARIELNSFDYRWNSNTEFDAHRTMNIGFINVQENRVIGYLTVTLNREHVINNLIAPMLNDYFNPEAYPGTVIWLHDWANDKVLATNNPTINFDRDLIDSRQGFVYGNMLENWNFKIGFLNDPIASDYNATLIKNLTVLGIAVLFLMGALFFMFFTAQRERNLSQRQAGFLANVTHELKTPLAVMQAAGENISDGRVTQPERLKQYGAHIYDESIRLRKMIEKLLDVAKSDSGQTMIKAKPANLNTLIRMYVQDNRDYIEGKGFDIKVKLEDHDHQIMIDHDNLETILSNLTENAIKYSADTKAITYKTEINRKRVFLKIMDRGIGIPRKHQKSIFKKFYRVEDSLNAKTKGHGLGLSIVQTLVELNKGEIDVSSEVGKGTVFTISFPIFLKDAERGSSANGTQTASDNLINTTEYA
jgi:signal transduction histidine kinase